MEIPTFKMVLNPDDEGLGLKLMSVVDNPAIMVTWAKFNEQEIKLSIQDEDQRIVFGPALIPDLPIKRSIMGEKFFVSIDRENILKTAIKFQKDNLANKIDENHSQNILSGITIFETFVTNENRVQLVKGFESLPMGTWFIGAKVNNDDIWGKAKRGELNGFSIDGLFSFKQAEDLTEKDIRGITREILNKL